MMKIYVRKKILFTRTLFGKWPQIKLSPEVQVSGASQGCQESLLPHSPTTYTLAVDSTSPHCLTCAGGWVWWGVG